MTIIMSQTALLFTKRSHIIMHLKKYFRPKALGNKKRSCFKIFLGFSLISVPLIIMLWDYLPLEKREDIGCFHESGNVLAELQDNETTSGTSIFFHETSCQHDCGDIHMKPRQACSVESALIAHPNIDVFLLVSSPIFVPLLNSKNILVQVLLTYPNFKARHIKFSKYLADTPMSVIDKSGALFFSQWPVAHASDVLRYATLYKFGGIYLDLDVMVLKSLSNLINFAGAESSSFVGSGIIGFGSDAVGREMAANCANELARTFNGDIWGFNGPGVITRVLQRRCRTSDVQNMSKEKCRGFEVHPVRSFAAISFNEPELFFQEDQDRRIEKLLNRSYTVHYWNKLSADIVLRNSPNIPFVKYAKIYCPKIFRTVNGFF